MVGINGGKSLFTNVTPATQCHLYGVLFRSEIKIHCEASRVQTGKYLDLGSVQWNAGMRVAQITEKVQ